MDGGGTTQIEAVLNGAAIEANQRTGGVATIAIIRIIRIVESDGLIKVGDGAGFDRAAVITGDAADESLALVSAHGNRGIL